MASYDDAQSIAGGAVQTGVGLATGNPIAIIGGIASLAGSALSFFGASKQAQVQEQEAKVSSEIAGVQMQIDEQRRQLATNIYQRQSAENFRRTQLALHSARAAGVQSGLSAGKGQGSSGVQGGEAQVTAEGATNAFNLGQEYQIGQNVFGLTKQEDLYKMQLAQLGGTAASYAGISALGSSFAQAGPAITRLTGGFGLPNPGIGFQQ